MAFDLADLSDVAFLNKNRTRYSYDTSDTLAEVLADGYFNTAGKNLRAGDTVDVSADDGTATLKVTAASAGAVTVASTGGALSADALAPGSVARSVAAKLKERISVLDIIPPEYHSAILAGESTDDVLSYFEEAQSIAKRIIIPAGRYYLSRAIRNVSNRAWVGDGPDTVLYNPQVAANTVNRCGFMLGCMHPGAFKYSSPSANQFPSYDISNVSAYASSVTCETAADAGNFSLGQFVWVRSQAETTAGGFQIPNYAQLNKVRTAGNASTGVVDLEDPIHEAITDACISPIGDTIDATMGYEWEAVENVAIRDMTIDARAPVSTRTAAYNCQIENLGLRNAELMLAVNALVKCRVKGLRGNWTVRGVEIKCASQDTDLEDIQGHCHGSASVLGGFSIGEQSNRIRARGMRITVGSGATVDAPALEINGWNIAVEDSEFANCSTYSGGVVGFVKSNSFTGYGAKSIALRRVKLVGTSDRTHHLRVGVSTESIKVADVDLDVTCVGATSTSRSVKFEHNSRGRVRGVAALALEISSTGEAPDQYGFANTAITSQPAVYTGTGSPESALAAPNGSIYLRADLTTGYTQVYLKTTALGTATGWQMVIPLTGAIERNASITLSTASAFHQYWTAAASDLFCKLPSQSSVAHGVQYWIGKLATTTGKLDVQDQNSNVIATIAAGDKGTAVIEWTGTQYRVVGVLTIP